MSALGDRKHLLDRKQEIKWVEGILKPEFFGVIKRFCGTAVAKYWLTGVLPAFRDGISPLSATRVISFDEEYSSLCGFTEKDVKAIIERALSHCSKNDQEKILINLKNWYNGYKFSPARNDSHDIPSMYNPQLVFVHLQKMISHSEQWHHSDEANAVHSATVLSS